MAGRPIASIAGRPRNGVIPRPARAKVVRGVRFPLAHGANITSRAVAHAASHGYNGSSPGQGRRGARRALAPEGQGNDD